jgi:hypothetical protein
MAPGLERQDEYLHPPGEAFRESIYFNVCDPSTRLGGFLRLANRPNEGYAEMTTCFYLPDGRVSFMFERPAISSNDAFDAGGMRFEVIRPFEEVHVSYQGRVVLLDNPQAMVEPREAFKDNPQVDATMHLTVTGVSTVFSGKPVPVGTAPSEGTASGEYEQLTACMGTVAVGAERWELNGFGLRHHSWGPQTSDAPGSHRWLSGNFGPSFGFMGSRVDQREGSASRGGFVWDGTALQPCNDCSIATTWAGSESYPDTIDVVLSAGERRWHLRGRVLSVIPLRDRRDGRLFRICEGLTEWTLDDGRIGYGLSEYADELVDGKPVGIGG